MSIVVRHRSAGPPAAPAIVAAARRAGLRLIRKFHTFCQAWRGRREIIALAALSDHELHDIGLVRADVLQAASVDLSEDPTVVLSAIVAERTRARRARYADPTVPRQKI